MHAIEADKARPTCDDYQTIRLAGQQWFNLFSGRSVIQYYQRAPLCQFCAPLHHSSSKIYRDSFARYSQDG